MKLVRYSVRGSSPRLGALVGDRVRCLGETYDRHLADRGVVRAGELAHALFPPSARDFLRAARPPRTRSARWRSGPGPASSSG